MQDLVSRCSDYYGFSELIEIIVRGSSANMCEGKLMTVLKYQLTEENIMQYATGGENMFANKRLGSILGKLGPLDCYSLRLLSQFSILILNCRKLTKRLRQVS